MHRILLIEDHDANQDLIARYLELFDCDVECEGDGRSGLAAARLLANQLDVVLLDMNLPEIDGLEVARTLKAQEATRHLPVIAVTANAMVGDRELALAAGCDDYATKPIDFHSLIQKIQFYAKRSAPK